DRAPPAGNGKGNTPEHALQQLHLHGEPARDQEPDQGRDRGALQGAGREGADADAAAEGRALPQPAGRAAGLEESDRYAEHRGQDRLLLTGEARTPWASNTTNRLLPAAAAAPFPTSPSARIRA